MAERTDLTWREIVTAVMWAVVILLVCFVWGHDYSIGCEGEETVAERTDLTTKELGEAIARAVIDEYPWDLGEQDIQPYADAVFKVLEQHGCWFCRISEHADGTHFEQMEMFK